MILDTFNNMNVVLLGGLFVGEVSLIADCFLRILLNLQLKYKDLVAPGFVIKKHSTAHETHSPNPKIHHQLYLADYTKTKLIKQ